jgi:Uma2 family endonuclease
MGVATVDHGQMEPVSEEEYLALPEDEGWRTELVDGQLLVSPMATGGHQDIVTNLALMLALAAPRGHRVRAGANVWVGAVRMLIPDVLVIAGDDGGLVTAASDVLLVAEVVSPSSGRHDRVRKPDLYAQAGIPTMLLVEQDEPRVTILQLVDGRTAYEVVAEAKGDDPITLTRPFDVTIVPSELTLDPYDWIRRTGVAEA